LQSLVFAASLAFVASPTFAVEETPNAIPGGTLVNEVQAKALFDKGAVFVDARDAAEYAEKHIKGAINVIYKEIHKKVSTLDPKDSFDMS